MEQLVSNKNSIIKGISYGISKKKNICKKGITSVNKNDRKRVIITMIKKTKKK